MEEWLHILGEPCWSQGISLIETAEYAVTKGIDLEPSSNWWVPHVLKKRLLIISLVCKQTTCYLKRTHKFGIEVPKTVKEALALDCMNGNTLWADAIAKEMREVRIAFNILPDGHSAPIGYQKIPCHMIFDMKMEDFWQKARLVAGGHWTKAPATITYASMVSHETVRLALTFASLNELKVKMGDVLNTYITASVKDKVWTILGTKFGHDSGKCAIIVHALYGLKSAGAAFLAHLASFMRQMGYTCWKADPDLWLKAVTRTEDNVHYYTYILCYVDDILCIHHYPMSVMNEINAYLPLKSSSVGNPVIYLGTKLKETWLPNGVMVRGLSPSKYVVQAVKNCNLHLTEKLDGRYSIPARADNPFPVDYAPSTDFSDIMDPDCSSFYQHLIGVMRWIVELGRIDIATEVSKLSSYLACPREGHLENALHVMGYLWLKHNSRLIFDPTYPDTDQTAFPSFEWMEIYGNVEEVSPPDMPPPLGKDVELCMVGKKRTRRSRTGYIIFCNLALIIWLSKQQATIETSVFDAEFVAMKHGIKTLRGLRY
jgi:hypothetical protein